MMPLLIGLRMVLLTLKSTTSSRFHKVEKILLRMLLPFVLIVIGRLILELNKLKIKGLRSSILCSFSFMCLMRRKIV